MARLTFEGRRYPLREGESALDAMLRGGAVIPFSCRKGSCHTCMLRVLEGDPGVDAQRGIGGELAHRGYFLPCKSHPRGDVVAMRPDPSDFVVRAELHARTEIGPGLFRLLLAPETNMSWRGGQLVHVRGPEGATRSYSLASNPENHYLELHVERMLWGRMSTWLCDAVEIGDTLEIQGPFGACTYDEADADRPLLLVGTGTGLAPLLGVLRDALARGHRGPVHLFHGARDPESLYLRTEIEELARRHPVVRYVRCVSGLRPGEGDRPGRVGEVAFRALGELEGWVVYLAGRPEVVYDARHRAILAGVRREDLHADSFEDARPFTPDDTTKLVAIAPDPELWEALGRGALLRAILTDFYRGVYEDTRLGPFFHGVTLERAIDKQYSFLSDVFTGQREYFGLKPFNAHHWMVISDELFDYREELIARSMRSAGLEERFVRRWSALHELFRREIVKGSARGMFVDGVERLREGFTTETVDVATVCDGCAEEMPAGSSGRLHARTGALFCARCAARRVGATLVPVDLAGDGE